MKKKSKIKNSNFKSKNNPLVSVVIPVFNGSPYLEETVYSVQNSSYKNIEILLIDDGSTDQSKSICLKLQKKYHNIHFYSFSKNKGLARVLNFALKKAKGKYICRLNQDDRMLKHRIATQVKFLEENPDVVAVGSSIRLFDNKGNSQIIHFLKSDQSIKKVWHILSPFSDPSVMYRKNIALKVGRYKQEFWPADDTHLWIRMGTVGKLANIDKPLVEVRYHKQAASVKYFRKLAFATYKMHLWMDKNIQKASFPIHLFWICQLIAGLIFPPDFNWAVYRILKKIVYGLSELVGFFNKKKAVIPIVNKVRIHPKKYNLSGV